MKQIVSIFKDTISSLEIINKNFEKEIEILRDRQNDSIQNSSTSNKEDETDKYNECDTLKNEIYDLQKTLVKFTKGRDNLNFLLENQRTSDNKVCLGYEPNNNSRNFSNIYNVRSTSYYKTLKCNYCNKEDHIDMFCFIKKIHDSKEGHPPSYFCKKHSECKIKNLSLPLNVYVSSINTNNVYKTNNKELNMI